MMKLLVTVCNSANVLEKCINKNNDVIRNNGMGRG
jgi:hypothetical protein